MGNYLLRMVVMKPGTSPAIATTKNEDDAHAAFHDHYNRQQHRDNLPEFSWSWLKSTLSSAVVSMPNASNSAISFIIKTVRVKVN